MTIKIKRKYFVYREMKKKMKDGELPFQETIYLFQKMFFVCERYWPDNYSKIKDYGKFRPQDPPSVFTCVKKSLIPTPLPPPRKTSSSSSSEVRSQLADGMPDFNKADFIPNFESLQNNVNSNYKSYKFMINVTDEAVILQ